MGILKRLFISGFFFSENGDSQLDVFRLGLILKRRKFTLSRSDPGDAKNDEELENVLSLLQSRVDGSLDSSLDAIALGLHEGFVVKVARTPFIMGKNLIRFSCG
ncbi:hypothetical protein V6Z11_A05G072100 [Gossypium hirsutum]